MPVLSMPFISFKRSGKAVEAAGSTGSLVVAEWAAAGMMLARDERGIKAVSRHAMRK